MKNKLLIISFIFITSMILLLLFAKKGTEAFEIDNQNYYPTPIIVMVNTYNGKSEIDAGMFYYGDLNLDGVINEDDINFMNSLLKGTLSFTDEQKLLVDFDKDGIATETDLANLKEFVKENNELKYSTYSNNLQYCITKENNSNNCNWLSKNEINLTEELTYYAFVKLKDTNKISNSYKFEYQKITFNPGHSYVMK